MKNTFFLLLTALLAIGAGCTATSGVDVNQGGVDVEGGIDLNEAGSVNATY